MYFIGSNKTYPTTVEHHQVSYQKQLKLVFLLVNVSLSRMHQQ
ncbi:unnamed protein product [Brugia timori]|uniref:Uncharacterized protein n=1 Tax=Brugia timori TaxID=42155 RepID=A0A0R3RAV3_9BILA|nr:unnamed protein product [Brugia timori]